MTNLFTPTQIHQMLGAARAYAESDGGPHAEEQFLDQMWQAMTALPPSLVAEPAPLPPAPPVFPTLTVAEVRGVERERTLLDVLRDVRKLPVREGAPRGGYGTRERSGEAIKQETVQLLENRLAALEVGS